MSADRVQDALTTGARQLAEAGIDGAPRDARVLMAKVLEIDPSRLTLHLSDPLSLDARARFRALIAARADRTPVSHLTGTRAFWGRAFHVTPDVLDPRPETETLVAEALRAPFAEVLDLGTGSGAILLSLMAERPAARGTGTDLSDAALAVARRNAQALGVTPTLIRADWWAGVAGQFDLITSNPPYIALDEMAGLAPEVLREPRMALTDERDGLSAYRAISVGARDHLRPGGRLLVEIGPSQGTAVSSMFTQSGLSEVGVICDLDGRDRVVTARR